MWGVKVRVGVTLPLLIALMSKLLSWRPGLRGDGDPLRDPLREQMLLSPNPGVLLAPRLLVNYNLFHVG